jgi:hypothetical protein
VREHRRLGLVGDQGADGEPDRPTRVQRRRPGAPGLFLPGNQFAADPPLAVVGMDAPDHVHHGRPVHRRGRQQLLPERY